MPGSHGTVVLSASAMAFGSFLSSLTRFSWNATRRDVGSVSFFKKRDSNMGGLIFWKEVRLLPTKSEQHRHTTVC